MKMHTLRLLPDNDLRKELIKFAKKNDIRAGSIVTCVGALKYSVLRMAGATPDRQITKTLKDTHEIISLVGTLTSDDCHLHIALSDREGQVVGGHLKEGSLVDLTAEVVILDDTDVQYSREPDSVTGFTELVIQPRS